MPVLFMACARAGCWRHAREHTGGRQPSAALCQVEDPAAGFQLDSQHAVKLVRSPSGYEHLGGWSTSATPTPEKRLPGVAQEAFSRRSSTDSMGAKLAAQGEAAAAAAAADASTSDPDVSAVLASSTEQPVEVRPLCMVRSHGKDLSAMESHLESQQCSVAHGAQRDERRDVPLPGAATPLHGATGVWSALRMGLQWVGGDMGRDEMVTLLDSQTL